MTRASPARYSLHDIAAFSGVSMEPGFLYGAFSPDGRTVVTISVTMTTWNTADPGRPVRLFRSRGDVVGGPGPAFSPNGRILATSGGEDEILWNVADPARPTQLAVLPVDPVAMGPALFSPDGCTVAGTPTTGDTVALCTLP